MHTVSCTFVKLCSTLVLHSKHSQRETKAPTSWAQQPGSIHTVPASCAGPALGGLSDGYKSPRITWNRVSGSWRTVVTHWADVAGDPISGSGSLSFLSTIKPFGDIWHHRLNWESVLHCTVHIVLHIPIWAESTGCFQTGRGTVKPSRAWLALLSTP